MTWERTDPAEVLRSVRGRDPERAFRRDVKRYERALGRARTGVFAGLVMVVATAVAAIVGAQPWWLVVTAAGGWLSLTSWHRLRTARPPRPPVETGLNPDLLRRAAPSYGGGWVGTVVGRMVGDAPVLRPSVGGAEVDRLARCEEHLAALLPAVERLHPGAGEEMRRALAETAPLLHQQVERLVVLDRLARDVPGTPAGDAARTAAQQVAERVGLGVAAYERLMAAAATLLGAPDLARSPGEVLGPAVDGLQSYAHGLAIAQDP